MPESFVVGGFSDPDAHYKDKYNGAKNEGSEPSRHKMYEDLEGVGKYDREF